MLYTLMPFMRWGCHYWWGGGWVVWGGYGPGRGPVVNDHHLHPGAQPCKIAPRQAGDQGLDGGACHSSETTSSGDLGAQCTQGVVVDAFRIWVVTADVAS